MKDAKRAISRAVLAASVAAAACLALAASGHAGREGAGAVPPTFARDIAPILYENCAACHHPGGSGPFSLLTFQDVRKRAREIVLVTERRYMPPWLPEPGHGDFAGERRLSDAEIALIKRWAEEGAAEGDVADLPAPPAFAAGWQLGQPDLVVKMPEAYTLPAEGSDVFRNFVIPIPVSSARYVRAVEILPGDKRLVHHANIVVDRNRVSRIRDERDPGPGFSGMDVSLESESFEPDSHFLFWKPGTTPWIEPDGMAWRLDPGTDLVLNMHLQPSGKPEPIQPAIGLYFTDRAPTAQPMLLQLEHDGAIDIPPGKADFVVTDELVLPVDVDLLGVYPHAHYLGRELEGTATLPDGTQRPLIRIPRWDLNWQAVYRYAAPVFLPKGTKISMRFTYDNSVANERNPSRPPRRVAAGDRAIDEMGHLWLQVLPRGPGDTRPALQEALMRRRLAKYPADFTAHFNLAAVLQSAGKLEEAVGHYRAALTARPDSAAAVNSLGTVFQQLGRLEEAVALYRRAVELSPRYANAHYNLGNSLLALNRPDEAAPHLAEVVRAHPDDAGAYTSLGTAYALQGDAAQAISAYERAIAINPEAADAYVSLGYVLSNTGDLAGAAKCLEQVVRLDPGNADAHNELGAIYGRQGDLARAAKQFEAALRADPAHEGARENLRRVQAMLGARGGAP
jgi:Flp pilus assembly protein TadD